MSFGIEAGYRHKKTGSGFRWIIGLFVLVVSVLWITFF